MMYCKFCGSENVSYVGLDDGGGDYGDSVVSIFYCEDCQSEIEGEVLALYSDYRDEGHECVMCGKSLVKHSGERCPACETVWNS